MHATLALIGLVGSAFPGPVRNTAGAEKHRESIVDRATACMARGEYAAAESLAAEAVSTFESTSPIDSLRDAESLAALALAMAMGGRFWHPRALEAAQRSLAIRERMLGPDHLDVAHSLFVLGVVLRSGTEWVLAEHGRDSAAAVALSRSLEIRRHRLGESDLEVARAFHWLGLQHQELYQGAIAESLLRRAAAIRNRRLPAGHVDRIESVAGLAKISVVSGAFDDSLFRQAIAGTEAILGPNHPTLAERLMIYASAERGLFRFASSRQHLERAVAIYERTLGENLLTARALNELGVTHVWSGDFPRAIPLFERGLAMAERVVGPSQIDVGKALIDLGDMLHRQGNEAEARRLLERGVSIWDEVLAADDPLLAQGLDMLGQHYQSSGEPERARAAFRRELEIRRKRLPPGSEGIGITLWRLAGVEADPETRVQLTEEAGNILVAVGGPNGNQAARGLALLADARAYRGRVDEAIRMAEQSASLWRTLRGPYSTDLAWTLLLLGQIHEAAVQESAATANFQAASEMFERVRGPDHTDVAMALRALADHLLRMGRPRDALMAATRADRIRREHLRHNLQFMPERLGFQLASSWNSTRGEGLGLLLQLACGPLSSDRDALEVSWDALIRSRAMILDVLAARRGLMTTTNDPGTRDRIERFEATVQRLSNLEVRGPSPDSHQFLDRWQAAVRARDQAESDLAESSRTSRFELQTGGFGVMELSKSLPQSTALVAYARVGPYAYAPRIRRRGPSRSHSDTLSARYVAFVMTDSASNSRLIDLGPAGAIDSLVDRWRQRMQEPPLRLHAQRSDRDFRREGERLRQAVWDSVARYCAEVDRILVVPDGALQWINFMTLPIGDHEYLVERRPLIHLLSAERDLDPTIPQAIPSRGLLAAGAPDYDAEPGALTVASPGRDSTGPAHYRGPRSSCREFRDVRFQLLPGASQEIEDLDRLWGDREGRADLITGARATETEFKQRARGHRILHLATHGFFVDGACIQPTSDDRGIGGLLTAEQSAARLQAQNESPLLLAGLAMAGANHRDETPLDGDDGILTADEIAALDLSGVEWAVLSACETGLGTIRKQEGVVGLRRALRVAGARTTIMSLWAVDDQSTRRWMTALYRARLTRNLDTAESVREASLELLRERRATGASTHPFAWGGFVAVGDWR